MVEVLNKDKLLEQAKLYADQGKLEKSLQEYQKVLQMDPKDLRLKLRVAELYVKLKKMTDAIRVYQEIATSYADDAFYLKAVTVYKNILRLNPSLLDVNRKLAELYEKMGLASDAIHQYQIVANMLEQKNMDADVLSVRQQIVTIAPDVAAHRIRLAEAYQLCGKDAEAINEYEILVKQIAETGKPDQLIELYEKILAHRPDNLEMVRALCLIYVKSGEWKKSLKRMEASEALVLQDPELLTMMAEFYAKQNQMATAGEKYRELGDLYVARQDVDHAITAYAACVVYAPEEEEDVRQVVQGLKESADAVFAAAVAARRAELQRLEDEETLEQEAKTAAATAAAVAPTARPTSGAVAPAAPVRPSVAPVAKVVDVAATLRQIDAAESLAATYQQMGLQDEAREEWQKALNVCEVALAQAADNANLKSKQEQLQKKLNPPVEAPKPVPPKSPLRSPLTSAAGSTTSKPLTRPGKKRISFI